MDRDMILGIGVIKEEMAAGKQRALFEVRDARIPTMSHPVLESSVRRFRIPRFICYTHIELVDSATRKRIEVYARELTGNPPLMADLSDYKNINKNLKKRIIEFLLKGVLGSSGGHCTRNEHLRGLACGFPNVGKSTILYVATKEPVK
jgi:ribosome biogenesis GTPase A